MDFIEIFDWLMQGVERYEDTNKEIFVEFVNGSGKTMFTELYSKAFEGYILVNSISYDPDGNGVDPGKVIKFLKSSVAYGSIIPKKVKVYTRVAGDLETGIEYDLNNKAQTSVKVTKDGWHVSEKKAKFISPSESLAQVKPVPTNKNPLNLLKKYINIQGKSFILYVVWLIHCFCSGMHIALVLMAEAGSGKTFTTECTRKIIDPSGVGIMHFPDKKDDLCVLLSQAFFVCFDNTTALSKEFSDVLCGAITGTAVVKRALYTNNNLSVLRLNNTIMLNGIDVTPSESDLADRMLVLPMKRIAQDVRNTDKELTENFNQDLPEILGSIFNTLSRAMNEIENVDRTNKPRMATSYVNMAAIAIALGVGEENFRNIFNENVEMLKKERTVNPVVEAVVEFMNRDCAKKKETGYVEELYRKIGNNYSGSAKAIGGSASVFSRRLRQEISTLQALGITVNLDSTGARGTWLELIKK